MAYTAAWLLLHCLARQALQRAYSRPSVAAGAAAPAVPAADAGANGANTMVIDDGADWSMVYGKRLLRTFDFVENEDTLLRSVVGVTVNGPVLHMLHVTLKADSKREQAVAAWARRQGVPLEGGNGDEGDETREVVALIPLARRCCRAVFG